MKYKATNEFEQSSSCIYNYKEGFVFIHSLEFWIEWNSVHSMASLLLSKRFLLPVCCSPSITLQCCNKVHNYTGKKTAELKSIASIPSPKSAVPFLGHSLLMMRRMHDQNFSEILEQFFKELGPLIRLKFPGG